MAKLAAVLLAAGASSRFGAENKLLMHLNGRPLVRGVAEEVLRSGIAELVVVTGCDAPLIEEALSGLPVRFARNEMWQTGMGSSIAAGVRALDTTIDGAFIVPADMPFLSADLLGGLMSAFERHDGARTIYPETPEGAQRNPVLWPRRTFPSLASLSGPQGAKPLLQSRDVSSVAVSVNDSTLLEDIDTPAALAAAQSAAR